MKTVIDSLIQKGIRSKYIIMIGGAPVNEVFAENIGADYFTPDAASCAEVARAALLEKRK
jgi:5-methyltetrahydrofolate--homocysteine methyltransferase